MQSRLEPHSSSISESNVDNINIYSQAISKLLASFKDNYLKSIIANLYIKHSELRDEIDTAIMNAINDRSNDSINKQIEEANLPGWPEHARLSDFDSRCSSETDLETYELIVNGKTLDDRQHPNLFLFGPPN